VEYQLGVILGTATLFGHYVYIPKY